MHLHSANRSSAAVLHECLPGPIWCRARLPEADATLELNDVHVWLQVQPPNDAVLRRDALLLSASEAQRAAAFVSATHRQRYIAAHGFLRAVLAHYTGIDRSALSFAGGAAGKPALVCAAASATVEFNLSHSGDLALCGVAQCQPLGVDVEILRPIDDLPSLTRSIFSGGERRQFDRLEPALRHEAFFAAWTRKEAVIKALGTGLSTEPARIEVAIDPRQPPLLMAIDGSGAAARRWTLWGARLPQDAWWAAACERRDMTLRLRCLEPDWDRVHTPR